MSSVEIFAPCVRPIGNGWTPERVTLLKQLHADDLTLSQLGRELGLTRNAIAGKLWRLGLTATGRRRPNRDPLAPRPKRKHKPRVARSKFGAWLSGPGGVPAVAPPAPPLELVAAPASAPVHFWQHDETTQCCCTFGELMYCSEPRQHLGARVPHSYCRFHGKEVNVAPRRRG